MTIWKCLLSIANVRQPDRVVAGVTAALVLLCNIYCACGGAVSGGSTPCHDVAAAAPASCGAHCHEPSPDAPGPSETQQPGGAPAGHTGCGHCDPVLSVSEQSTTKAKLDPVEWDAAFLPLFIPSAEAPSADLPATASGKLLPLVPAATLLSLHCALNT